MLDFGEGIRMGRKNLTHMVRWGGRCNPFLDFQFCPRVQPRANVTNLGLKVGYTNTLDMSLSEDTYTKRVMKVGKAESDVSKGFCCEYVRVFPTEHDGTQTNMLSLPDR